ncbi:hypothetical protein [Blastococcus goldschmidtiae]|uniref:Tissue inhibitor of metalloproteinase n=1 Tax=Blastococcus goldschmidtiae TaxID=3075546 RepID=A0ABU2K372_9ACTN|nr:hypothetical protein [Blastococcus sp. DSM 46792]MDT0274639.1 hypothetical protein [Blastococcus sp. DSM 46792]
MRRPAVVLLLGALLSALGMWAAAPAQACSCAGGTTAHFAERADVVFTGRLESREPAPGSLSDVAVHVFAVDSVVKGRVQAQQEIVSAGSGASCGLELSGRGPVVVFASRSLDLPATASTGLEDGQYAASLCGGTAPLTPELEAELAAVPATGATAAPQEPEPQAGPGPQAGPEPRSSSTENPTDRTGPVIAGLAALAALAALGGATLVRRRRAQAGRP